MSTLRPMKLPLQDTVLVAAADDHKNCQRTISYKRHLGIRAVFASWYSVLPAWYFAAGPGSYLEFMKLIPSARFVNFDS